MSSLKSAALLSLFSDFSFADVQRAFRQNGAHSVSVIDVAHAARFSAPAQAAVGDVLVGDNDVVSPSRERVA